MRTGTRLRSRLIGLVLVGAVVALLASALKTPPLPTRGAPPGIPYAWGLGSMGELGNGSTANSSVAVQVAGLSNAVALSAGRFHSLALDVGGRVWAWGGNYAGQLGIGSLANSVIPVPVGGLPAITAIAGGGIHSLALDVGGQVWAWGSNSFGQLGDGTTTDSNVPVLTTGLPAVSAIAGGGFHSLALDGSGNVWAWGRNSSGQLGDGTTTDSSVPVPVLGLPPGVIAIAAGGDHSLALDGSGNVWAWGDNSCGQLGTTASNSPNTTPVLVSGLPSNIVAIAAGWCQSLALASSGQVWAWGGNFFGQLGNGSVSFSNPTPGPVASLSGIVAIATNGYHGLALDGNGNVWAWGWNSSGQLGDGTTTDSSTPVMVLSSGGNPLSGVTAIAAGGEHSLALAGAPQPTPTATPCVPNAANPCQTPTPTATPCVPNAANPCLTPLPTETPPPTATKTPPATSTPCVRDPGVPCETPPATGTPRPTGTPCKPDPLHPCDPLSPTRTPSPTPTRTPTPTPTPTCGPIYGPQGIPITTC